MVDRCREISDEGIKDFSQSLECLNMLKDLNLNFSKCIGFSDISGMPSLSAGLRNLKELQTLTLRFDSINNLTLTGKVHIGSGLNAMTSLQNLHLDFSQ